ncbi:MAG: PKD domain-containing protein [Saprospiraceae bacterium]
MKKLYMQKMWKNFKALTSVTMLVLLVTQANATHIVGGNITYRCVAKDIYEVTMVVRRDCYNGDPEAFFDDPASIGIFDRTGELMQGLGTKGQLLLKLNQNDTLESIMENLCSLDGVNSVCIHETTYRGTVFLPFRPGGYYLMYQRCCRNVPIQNIKEPLETGASWVVHISDLAMSQCNSSPVFKKWSPIFICVGKPFRFDHGATDKDGDSLVYKLWTPYTGATRNFPKPQPPNKPDFNPISWQEPYSQSDMLGGDPIKIDSKTGEITAVPGTLGQFLIGVQVEEYRNGQFIGTVFRDYEVKIIDCTNLVDAKIIAPALQCDDLTVNFKQESQNALHSRWFFDFDRNLNATSSEAEPTYKYTDTGTYKVALVITRDSTCFDTAFQIVRLKLSSATTVDFAARSGECINGDLQLSLTDLSTGVDPNAKYIWTITYNGQTISSNLKNPVITVPNGVVATVKLDISEEGNGCDVSFSKTFVTSFVHPEDHADQMVVCTGDTTTLKFVLSDSIKAKYNYTWDPSPLIVSGANSPEPKVFSPINQAIYLYVTVDNKAGCTSRDSILIISLIKPTLAFTFTNACGSLKIKVNNQSDQLTNYQWDFGDGTTAIEREPEHTYTTGGIYTVTLRTTDGCAPSLSKTFNLGNVSCLSLVDSVNGCVGNPLAINPRANPAYTYIWRPTDKLDDLSKSNPIFIVDSARTFIADFFDANTGIGLGSLTIIVKTPTSDQVDFIKDSVLACAGQGVGLNPGGNPALKYEWSPAQFLDDAKAINPIATVNGQTVFTVTVTNPADTCVLSKQIVVVIPSSLAADAIPDSIDVCNDVPAELNPQGKADPNLKYQWSPGNVLDDSTSFNPKATIVKPTIFTVTITDTRFDDCKVTKTVKLNIPIVDEVKKIMDSIKACAGVPTPLNPTGSTRFKYEWTPAAGLDNPNIANPSATVNQTTTYNVKITDTQRGNCTQSKAVKVIVPPDFKVTPSYKDTISCTATSFLLKASSNNPKVTFEWFLPSGTRVATKDTFTANPLQRTVYRVVGTDENGCRRTDSVIVDPGKINIKASLVGPDPLCQGVSAGLQVTGQNPAQALTYEWSPTASITSGANTANPQIKPDVSTTYRVKVSNAQGCLVTDSVRVNVSPVGTVTSTANPTTITIGQTSQITTTILPGYTYSWSPSETLDNPNVPNPVATPKQTTTYNLTVTSPDGCVATRAVTITVNIPECAEPFIFLPNAFSPNGDGKNDVLYLRSNIVDRMSLIIYDRWGEKVFETTNQSVGWDGTYKGKLLPPDVYGYYLTVICIDGQQFMKKGNVTILR